MKPPTGNDPAGSTLYRSVTAKTPELLQQVDGRRQSRDGGEVLGQLRVVAHWKTRLPRDNKCCRHLQFLITI